MMPLLLLAVLAQPLQPPPTPRLGVAVTVDSPTAGPVVGLAGDVVVRAEVVGDVVAVAGNVVLEAGAHVHGDVVVVGGRVQGEGQVGGRIVGLALSSEPVSQLAAPEGRRLWVGVALLRLGVWLVAASLLLLAAPRLVRRAGEPVQRQPLRTTGAGVAMLVLWLAVVILAVAAAARGGTVVLLGGLALLLAAKGVGVMAVAWVLARVAAPALPLRWRGEMARTNLLLALLVAGSLLPVVGSLLWLATNLVGIGGVTVVLFERLRWPHWLPLWAKLRILPR